MKQLNLYFGEKSAGFGWGSSADILKCTVPDDFDLEDFLGKPWAALKIEGGTKIVNTLRINWLDLLDTVEEAPTVNPNTKSVKKEPVSTGQQKLYDTVEKAFGTDMTGLFANKGVKSE